MRFKSLALIFCLYAFATTGNAKTTGYADRPQVKKFIAHMVSKYHFKSSELVAAFNTIKPKHTVAVVRSVQKPLEQRPWYNYQLFFVTESRIREGVQFWKKHRTTLEQAEKKYGVPASIIVATIGVETKYGKNVGKYRVLDALAGIAFSKSHRANYFRSELEHFFLLTREQHLNPTRVMGSYAGAIGQPQFMPSSYRHYAVSSSGNKKIDLTHNEADIITSIANYYQKHGWSYEQPVAMKTTLSGSRYLYLSDLNSHELSKRFDVARYADSTQKLKVIPLENYFGYEYWLGFHNFSVIKRYNPSNLYAMAVYQLSHYIDELHEKTG